MFGVDATDSLYVAVIVLVPVPAGLFEYVRATVGGVLSTVNVVDAPIALDVLPAVSDAVPAAIDIPKVPSPVMFEIVTALVAVPEPVTATVPFAVPVLFKVTFPFARVTVSAPVYVMVYVIGPDLVIVADGEPMEFVGPVVSIVNVLLVGAKDELPNPSTTVDKLIVAVPSM